MISVVLQPMGSKTGHEHTIFEGVQLKNLKKRNLLDSKDYDYLEKLYPDGIVRVWGITPTRTKDGQVKKDSNKTKWSRITQGDVVLLKSKPKTFTHKAIVTHKINSKKLADFLWGTSNGYTWEHIYFIDELEEISIKESDFNEVVGYSSENITQGFMVLDADKSQKFIDKYEFVSSQGLTDEDEEVNQIKEKLDLTDQELDKVATQVTRAEQSKLRKYLFGGKKEDRCVICGESMPIELLVVGHIKKRSICSDEEKRDFNNLAPMCRFGCDELFERGYFGVSEGKVVLSKNKRVEGKAAKYLSGIDGNSVRGWSEGNKPYYDSHRTFHAIY